LFNTNEDFSLSNNLAAGNEDKLKALQDLFMAQGEKYHVLPLDDRLLERTNAELMGRPTVMGNRNTVTYGEGMKGMGVDIFIDLRNKGYTITSEVAVDANGNGVIVCQGGRFGGLSLYLKNGKPAFTYNYLGLESTDIIADQSLKPGNYKLVYDFKYDGDGMGKGGVGTIYVNDKKVAEKRLEKTQPGIFSVDDLADIGIDDGTHVADYGTSSKFNGKINYVTIERKK
jgi:arylsulfatase